MQYDYATIPPNHLTALHLYLLAKHAQSRVTIVMKYAPSVGNRALQADGMAVVFYIFYITYSRHYPDHLR